MTRFKPLFIAACIGVIALLFTNPAGADDVPDLGGAGNAAAAPLAGPYFVVFKHSDKCLAIPNNSTENVQLHQWGCFSTSSELWHFDYVFTDSRGYNLYRIRSALSGKCLNIGSNSIADGAPVIQYPCGDFTNEYFAYLRNDRVPASYGWLLAYSSNKVVNISGASTANGAKVIQWMACNCTNEYVALT